MRAARHDRALRRLMMQIVPGHATAYRRTMVQEPGQQGGAKRASLTPAERIALSIALLNRGLDVMDGFARATLAGCARGAVRGRHDVEQQERPHRTS